MLVGASPPYRVTTPLPAIPLSPTVQAVLAARIDRLSPDDKVLLQSAAVVGKDVGVPILRSIVGLPEHELLARLASLQAAEFLNESRLFPDLEYTFKHALTQEVAYGSLLQDRRMELHARIVGAIESRVTTRMSEYCEVLAHHAVRGELWEKAVDYLREAGTNAWTRGALPDSLERFEQALALLPHLSASTENVARAIDVRFDLQRPVWALGQMPRLTQLTEEAELLAQQINDRLRLARNWVLFSRNAWVSAQYPEGIRYAEQASSVAEATDNVGLRIASVFLLGAGKAAVGDYVIAAQLLGRVVDGPDGQVAKRLPSDIGSHYVGSCFWLVLSLLAVGDFARARTYTDAAHDVADAFDSPHDQATAYLTRAIALADQGDFAEAVLWSERAVRLCEATPILPWLSTANAHLGWTLALSRRAREGLGYLERSVMIHESLGMKVYLSMFYARWAEGLLLEGDVVRARERAQQALDLAARSGERGIEATAYHLLGAAFATGAAADIEQALRHYERARALGAELGMRPLVAHCHLGLGELHRRTGKREQAHEHLTTARTMYREMGMRFWLEQAEAGELNRSVEGGRT